MVSVNKAFLACSATFVSLAGLGGILKPDVMMKATGMEINGASNYFFQVQGCLMLGWGVGKWTAVLVGPESCVTAFATFNLFPMGMLVLNSMPPNPNLVMGLIFSVGYLYIVTTGVHASMTRSFWGAGFYFLCFSALTAVSTGIVVMSKSSELLATGWIGHYEHPQMAIINSMGTAAIGWGAGKWASVFNGDQAMHLFCKLNLIPIGIMTVCAVLAKQHLPAASGGFFFLAYAFLAATGPKVKARELAAEPLLLA